MASHSRFLSTTSSSQRHSQREPQEKKAAASNINLRIDPRLRAPKPESSSAPTNTQPRPGRFETTIDKLALVAYPVDPKSPTNYQPASPTPSLASTLSNGSSASDFSVSEHDEVIRSPYTSRANDNTLRLSFRILSPSGSVYAHTILASSVSSRAGQTGLSSSFVGILRTMHADRPYFHPSGPPVWTAEYTPLYEICGTFYSQHLSATPSSLHKSRNRLESTLYMKRVAWLGELASMHLHLSSSSSRSQNPIGCTFASPTKQRPEWYSVPVFEESNRYSDTGFEPLEGPRPLCRTPEEIGKCDECREAELFGNAIGWPPSESSPKFVFKEL